MPKRHILPLCGLWVGVIRSASSTYRSAIPREMLLYKQSEEYPCKALLPLGIHGEQLILIDEVVDHAGEDVLLKGILRGLERLEHLNHFARLLKCTSAGSTDWCTPRFHPASPGTDAAAGTAAAAAAAAA